MNTGLGHNDSVYYLLKSDDYRRPQLFPICLYRLALKFLGVSDSMTKTMRCPLLPYGYRDLREHCYLYQATIERNEQINKIFNDATDPYTNRNIIMSVSKFRSLK